MSKVDWNKAPKDAQFFSGGYCKHEGDKEFIWFSGEWVEYNIPRSIDWHRGRPDFEMRPESPAWNSGDLPPVGTVCEISHNNTKIEPKPKIGQHVEIIAHTMTKSEIGIAVFKFDDDMEGTYVGQGMAHRFRPIKSDREKWIERANEAIRLAPLSHDALGTIYDAGLAKLP